MPSGIKNNKRKSQSVDKDYMSKHALDGSLSLDSIRKKLKRCETRKQTADEAIRTTLATLSEIERGRVTMLLKLKPDTLRKVSHVSVLMMHELSLSMTWSVLMFDVLLQTLRQQMLSFDLGEDLKELHELRHQFETDEAWDEVAKKKEELAELMKDLMKKTNLSQATIEDQLGKEQADEQSDELSQEKHDDDDDADN